MPIKTNATIDLRVPGSLSAQGNIKLAQTFAEDSATQLTFIAKQAGKKIPAAQWSHTLTPQIGRILPGRVITQIGRGQILALIYQSDESILKTATALPLLRTALEKQGLKITGGPAILADITPLLLHDLHLGELFAAGAALLLLLIRFRRPRPVLAISLSCLGALALAKLLLLALSHLTPLMSYSPNLVSLLAMGLALDYSYLSWRRSASDNLRAIFTSAIAFTLVSLTGALFPIPFLRSVSLALAIAPMAALIAFGLVKTAIPPRPLTVTPKRLAGWFAKVALKPVRYLGFALILTLVASAGLFGRQISASTFSKLPSNLPSSIAATSATGIGGQGAMTPVQVLLPIGNWSALTKEISSDNEVLLVATDHKAPFVSHGYQRFFIFLKSGFDTPSAHAFDQRLIHAYLPKAGPFFVSGASIQGDDLVRAIGRSLPEVGAIAFILLWVFLAWRLKSVWLPVKSNLLALASATSGMGLMAWVLPHFQLEAWALVMAALTLFALTLDYEIFLLTEIKAARKNESEDFITFGLAKMAPIILDAGALFAISLFGLIFGHFLGIEEFGLALALSVIFDLTVVRLLAMPALMHLLGQLNWWWPTKKEIAPSSPIE